MLKFDNLVDNKIAQNIAVWLCLFIILMATITSTENRMVTSFYGVLMVITPIYVSNIFVLPYLKTSKIKFFLLFVLNIIFWSCVTGFVIRISSDLPVKFIHLLNLTAIIFLATIFGAAIKLARDSFTRRQQEKEAELKLLKAQLNPHFLFNTLNNLYGLSVVKSDKLPNLMLKLSDLLRYSLYETKEELVPLSKEIEYLENYISLEKIRLENTEINFTVNGNINEKEIAPMLFIVFVENAFKHLSSEKSMVGIIITSEENKLQFSCKNSVDTVLPLEENLEKGKSGIGLVNAKKRLKLMYPEKHQLKINTKNNIFSVDLMIEV